MKNHIREKDIDLNAYTWCFETFNFCLTFSYVLIFSQQNATTKNYLNRNQEQSFEVVLNLLFTDQVKLLFIAYSLALKHCGTKIGVHWFSLLLERLLDGFYFFFVFFISDLCHACLCSSHFVFKLKIEVFGKVFLSDD